MICPLLHLLRHAIVSYVRNTVTTYVTPKPWLLPAFDRVFSWEVLILTFAYYMASPFWSTADCYCLMADKMLTQAATNYVAQRNLF